MISGFNNGDFDLKLPIPKIKLHQIKVLYGMLNCDMIHIKIFFIDVDIRPIGSSFVMPTASGRQYNENK